MTTRLAATAKLFLTSVAVTACFQPDTGANEETTTDASSSGDGGGVDSAAESLPGEDSSSPTTSLGTTGDDGGSGTVSAGDSTTDLGSGTETGDPDPTGGPIPVVCGDGLVAPGELCLPENPVTHAVGAGAMRMAVGEFNANLDVVTVNPTSYTISILMGDGVGGFAAPVSKSAGDPGASQRPSDVAVGDIDADGDVDIMTLSSGELRWFRNNGGGQFPGTGDAHEARNPFGTDAWMLMDNFDADPALDVAWTEGYNTIIELGTVANDGTFGFRSPDPSSIQITGGDQWVAATEFGYDGDGFRDILIGGRWAQGNVVPVRGNGDGTWQTSNPGSGAEVEMCGGGSGSCEPEYLHAADLNDDGETDILLSHDQGFSVALGAKNGTYTAAQPYPADHAGQLLTTDLDNDGVIDVVLAATDERALKVFLGSGDGTFGDPLDLAVEGSPRAVAVGDANNDGALDVLTCYGDKALGRVAVFLSAP